MPIFDTFSKRQKKREQAGQPDVYQYDDLPQPFRIQVIHIWEHINYQLDDQLYGALGRYSGLESSVSERVWYVIERTLARELGLPKLGDETLGRFSATCQFLKKADTAGALDLIDLSFHALDDPNFRQQFTWRMSAEMLDDAIDELNHRFREHGIGYQFTGGELIRVDSQYLHAEVVTPALALMQTSGFAGAEDEFRRAHEHYRHGRNKEAVVEALKSFESTLKTICDARWWQYPAGAAAKDLLKVIFDQGLVPPWMQNHLSALKTVLEGLPTLRNKTSGHGQGSAPVAIPDHFVAYALHLAGANIVFLVEAHRARD